MKTLAAILLTAAATLSAAPDVQWQPNLEAAKAQAKASGKRIFLDVSTEWCGWCKKLQHDTFPSDVAKKALAKVIPVSVETQKADGSPTENKSLEQRYRVDGFPTLLILDANGNEVARQPGYLPPERFAAWIEANAK
jgi:thioredoxin-related protein